jgi:hypothetical protein
VKNREGMDLKERIAWLGRMPLRWKILLGVQTAIMTTAFNFRLNDIRRAKIIQAKQLEADDNVVENNVVEE